MVSFRHLSSESGTMKRRPTFFLCKMLGNECARIAVDDPVVEAGVLRQPGHGLKRMRKNS
jgi:hypothetical protein